jgi:hypothetical protein
MQIVKLEDIVKLSQILNENGFANKDITINIGVKTPEMLNRINEEIYFRNSNKENNLKIVDEIILNVGGYKYKYYVNNEEN